MLKGFGQQYGDCTFAYVNCSYKRPQREYFLHLMNKSIILLPVDVFQISYNDLQHIKFERDTKHSTDQVTFVKLTITARGSHYELTKMNQDAVQNLISFIRRKSLTGCKISDEFQEMGGRSKQTKDNVELGEEDDEDWDENEDESGDSSAKYEYESGADDDEQDEVVKV